jgi:hypothetical protein
MSRIVDVLEVMGQQTSDCDKDPCRNMAGVDDQGLPRTAQRTEEDFEEEETREEQPYRSKRARSRFVDHATAVD